MMTEKEYLKMRDDLVQYATKSREFAEYLESDKTAVDYNAGKRYHQIADHLFDAFELMEYRESPTVFGSLTRVKPRQFRHLTYKGTK